MEALVVWSCCLGRVELLAADEEIGVPHSGVRKSFFLRLTMGWAWVFSALQDCDLSVLTGEVGSS